MIVITCTGSDSGYKKPYEYYLLAVLSSIELNYKKETMVHLVNFSPKKISMLTNLFPFIEAKSYIVKNNVRNFSEHLKTTAVRIALDCCSESVLNLDADTLVRKPLDSIFMFKEDIGISYKEPPLPFLPEGKVNTGVVCLKNNDKVRKFTREWEIRANSIDSDWFGSQRTFWPLKEELGITVYNIPYYFHNKIDDIGLGLHRDSAIWHIKGKTNEDWEKEQTYYLNRLNLNLKRWEE